jgi:putative transposase
VKAKKYTEEQIITVLNEGEGGNKVVDLCRKYGMSDATYYNWKAKYDGITVSRLRRLKALEAENRRLKQIDVPPLDDTRYNLIKGGLVAAPGNLITHQNA